MEPETFRTRNLDEAMHAVQRVYCPHSIVPQGPVRNVEAALAVVRVCGQPVVNLRYSTPVTVNAGNFPDLMLMMSATAGAASAVQGGERSQWRSGQTMPLSPGQATQLGFDRDFAQSSLRIEIARAETMCARWLGHPLHAPLRFALRPFAADFEAVWQDAMRMTATLGSAGVSVSHAAADSLDEFLLSLLLHGHPHNFSQALRQPVEAAPARQVRMAEEYFRAEAASGITVSAVAARMGISLRSLQAGFRQVRGTTPLAALREVRLDAVHAELGAGSPGTSVTSSATGMGFTHLGRFGAAYKARFGESPAWTLRRGRMRH